MSFAPLALLAAGGVGLGTQRGRNYLFGKDEETKQFDRYTPQQQAYLNNLLRKLGLPMEQGMQILQNILSGDEGAFEDFEAPIKRQFEQEVVPQISERFAGLGTGGSLSSSGLNQSLSQAGRELSENLAQLRSGLQFKALDALKGFGSQALNQQFDTSYRPESYGAFLPGMVNFASNYYGGGQ